jgi:ubiquinone/menaquinone biosynthesis C-methylase UbiE
MDSPDPLRRLNWKQTLVATRTRAKAPVHLMSLFGRGWREADSHWSTRQITLASADHASAGITAAEPIDRKRNFAMPTQADAADFTLVKQRQQATWATGDYAVIGTTLQIVGELLCEAVDIRSGEQVLDVAAGNGNASLAAARHWCDVVATDYVGKLLDKARARAAAEGREIRFREADAENLPFPATSFDVVLSTFGVMFAPDQERAASELVRVCRPGGRIGLASWTPDGFAGQLFKTFGRYLPQPPGVGSPALWGTEEHINALFHGHEVVTNRRLFNFRYKSIDHWLEVSKSYFGPTNRAFAALDQDKQEALQADLVALLSRMNRGGTSTLIVPSEYLEVVVTRR